MNLKNKDFDNYRDCLGFSPSPWGPPKKEEPSKNIEVNMQVNTQADVASLSWEGLQKTVSKCVACRLAKGRSNVVFGEGNPQARLMFIGEAPGADEDEQGMPFVGRSGQLLTKMIEAMGLSRKDIFIANVIKCRPPDNRNPQPDEIEKCGPFLFRQIEMINPEVIVVLGTFAAQTILETDQPISKMRGEFFNHPHVKRADGSYVKVMPTFHPAFCLRNPNMKKPVWEDLQKVMKELGLKLPPSETLR